jgi:geranylgeranylglycerol-phosphate geranylgeranyltransferase
MLINKCFWVNLLNPYIDIIRPHNSLMAAFAVLIGVMVASGDVFSQAAFLGFIVAFIASGAGFIINDYFDFDIDTINKPQRPLPSGNVSLSWAKRSAILLFGAGILLSFLINAPAFIIAIFNSFLLYAYGWKIKKAGGIEKNLTVSYLVASPFLFGGAVAGNVEPTLYLVLLAGLANTSREIVKDIEDFEGDRLFAATLPQKIGFGASAKLAQAFMLAALLLSPLPYITGVLGRYYLFLVALANVLFLVSFVFLRNITVQNAKKTQRFIKLGMFLALVAFLVGSI